MQDRQRRERRLGKLGAEKRERLEGLRHATRKARLFPALQCGIYIRYSVPAAAGGRASRASRPLPPAHSEAPSRPTRVQTQEPSRVGMDEPPQRRAPTRQGARRLPSPTRAPLQGRRGAPGAPALIGRAFRSSARPPGRVSTPAGLRGGPARPRALTHLDGLSLASRLPSTTAGTQLVSSVQSAGSPQLQPVENLEKSQVSRLPGRWQVHFF